jgi:hypothetical protein
MYFCVVLRIVSFVTFPIFFVCICVLNNCHRVATQLQLNISYHIIHFIYSLSYDRSKASSKASCPHSAIQSFLFQMRLSSPFLKVIQ